MSVSVTSVAISPVNPSVTAGTEVSLKCTATVSGSFIPTFTWTKPGSLSSGNLTAKAIQPTIDNILYLGKVSQSDVGIYTCTISISDSSLSTYVMLTVTSKL